jgi:two-component system, NarL family, response regulator DevR
MSRRPARVLIVDDHEAVAEALASLINDERDMRVVGTAGSVAESIMRVSELEPDVVLLDFRLPDGTGADAGSVIQQDRPQTKLIFVTRDNTTAARTAAINAGASGFIHKSQAAARVVDAIRIAVGGVRQVNPETA